MTRTAVFFAALVATAATVSFPAYAQEAAKTARVSFADLNLASTDGAKELKVRVARAATRVCHFEGDRTLDGAAQARACSKQTVANTMPQVELALANAGTQVAQAGHISVAAH